MNPQEIRNMRLKHDYSEMLSIRGPIIAWKAIKGTIPFVEEYEIIINIKSIIGPEPKYRNKHIVKVVLPSSYPNSAPDIRMITRPFVFHPNWYKDGKWCFGSWNIGEGLADHVLRMIRTLQYDLDITNEHSPANSYANAFYTNKRRSGIFPCDKATLPIPSQLEIEPKKKFVINDSEIKKFIIKN
jgi:ubiquitin-protein ligase